MKTFPSGFQSYQLYPHNGRKTEGKRKGNGREIEARRRHLSRTRLGLVTESSSSTESCQNDSLPKPSTKRKWNGRELARHSCLETGGTCSPVWCDIGQAGTSLVIWIYPHNGRKTEGERKDDKSVSRKSLCRPVFHYQFYPHNGRKTEGQWKGNGRDSQLEMYPMHRFYKVIYTYMIYIYHIYIYII